MYTDPDGRWFGIDDLIVSGVSFIGGYLQHGFSTGDWGGDALAAGGIAAGSTWLAYNTGGMAAGWMFKGGSAGFALTASTVGGVVGGFTNSVGMQAYYTGKVDLPQAMNSGMYGAMGGAIGGAAGQFLTPDPVLTSMIGGAAVGGIQGGYRGAFGGAFYGGLNGAFTSMAYEAYGEYIKNHILEGKDEKSYYENKSCRGFSNDYLNEFDSNTYDLAAVGPSKRWGGPNSPIEAAHQGIVLGRTNYGQHMVISKLNVNHPIVVETGSYLRSIYGNPFKITRIRIPNNLSF